MERVREGDFMPLSPDVNSTGASPAGTARKPAGGGAAAPDEVRLATVRWRFAAAPGTPGAMRRRNRTRLPSWLAPAALLGGVVAAIFIGRRGTLRRLTGRSDEEGSATARESWQCACGQLFVVTGRDRHRVYWVQGAPESDPVLAHRCPSCDRELPVESIAAA
jgi:hypothetical protein